MRVHWLQHAAEDGLGCIAPWLAQRGHRVTHTAMFRGDPLPPRDDFDALLIMGGSMNVDQEAQYPWLRDEKRFIADVLTDAGKRVFGICLGAQLIAEQCGAWVGRNAQPEVGWWDIELTDAGCAFAPMADWPARVPMFHWHGDTFELPPGAQRLAFSQACAQQAFVLDQGRVLAVQFHPEVTPDSVRVWLQHPDSHPSPGPFVQSVERMRDDEAGFARANQLLHSLLDRWLVSA